MGWERRRRRNALCKRALSQSREKKKAFRTKLVVFLYERNSCDIRQNIYPAKMARIHTSNDLRIITSKCKKKKTKLVILEVQVCWLSSRSSRIVCYPAGPGGLLVVCLLKISTKRYNDPFQLHLPIILPSSVTKIMLYIASYVS